jgi:hypothetical protein
MLSIWGLVNILGVTFGISGGALPQVTPPGSSSSGSSTTPSCPPGESYQPLESGGEGCY